MLKVSKRRIKMDCERDVNVDLLKPVEGEDLAASSPLMLERGAVRDDGHRHPRTP